MKEKNPKAEEAKENDNKKIMERVVVCAVEYLAEGLKATNTQIKQNSLRLEEIVGSSKSQEWTLTLSYIDASTENAFAALYGNAQSERIYKTIVVSTADEKYNVISIKERTTK